MVGFSTQRLLKRSKSSSTRHSTSSSTTPLLKNRLSDAVYASLALSSPGYRKQHDKAVVLINLLRPYNEAKYEKLEALIRSDPGRLLYARVPRNISDRESAREGFTPLHMAAWGGHAKVVQLMLSEAPAEVATELVQMVTQQGETALHLAASQGHDDVAVLLRDFCLRHHLDWQATDALNRTPLGAGLMSPVLGRSKKASVMDALFSPEDTCVFGPTIDPGDRSYYLPSLAVAVAVSEMPGRRAAMEDATLLALSSPEADNNMAAIAAVVGVLDGHDDGGRCSGVASELLGSHLLGHYERNPASGDDVAVQEIFQTADDALRQRMDEIPGGTTACVAAVTLSLLQVANVGDSRCILVQQYPAGGEAQSLEEQLGQLSLTPSDTATVELGGSVYAVLSLSRDHKPSLPQERARIEAAGLQVIEVPLDENTTVSKVHMTKKLKTSELAMSRSLGDFEFKAKRELPSDRQAVVAIPEVVTRERSEHDALLIVACDGVWDILTNVQAAEFVMTQIQLFALDEVHVLARVADRMCRHCFDAGSDDNLSVVLVALGETATRLTPATIASPASDTDAQPRKLAFDDAPMAVAGADAEIATPSSQDLENLSAFQTPRHSQVHEASTEELSAYRTPGQVQVL